MLDIKKLEEKGFCQEQINQIVKIHEITDIDLSSLPITADVDKLREIKNDLANSKYSPLQEACLVNGLEHGVDITIYANPKYSVDKMNVILNALIDDLKINHYVDLYNLPDGNNRVDDLEIIFEGLRYNLDVSKYESPNFNYLQKVQIKQGLMSKLPVEIYAKECYNEDQMCSLFKALRQKIDVSKMANPLYPYEVMELIRNCLEKGLEITDYINTNFKMDQVLQIKKGMEREINVSLLANENYSPIKMKGIRKLLEYNRKHNTNWDYKIFLLDNLDDNKILGIIDVIKNGDNTLIGKMYQNYCVYQEDIER